MTDKPTHYINESSSCIDLIFSSNVNITKNCGIEQSFYKTCHHNIIYRTLNFNIPLPPPFFFNMKFIFFFNKFNSKITRNNYTKVKIITITIIALT